MQNQKELVELNRVTNTDENNVWDDLWKRIVHRCG